MKLTILGSGGCAVIPKPLCQCNICKEARNKGIPYSRTGPAAFIHDENILIDTPAEIALQLNRSGIEHVDYLLFTHLDPDHVEGFRVVEQIANDFRTWQAHPDKQICLVLPRLLKSGLGDFRLPKGSFVEFYEKQKYITCNFFQDRIKIGEIQVTAIRIGEGSQVSFIYVFEKQDKKIVYAPCDIKPFPEEREELKKTDLLVIQPGIFEDGLKHSFTYPKSHKARTALFSFEETMALSRRIQAKRVLFVHLEEYWNRSYADYEGLEKKYKNISFAYDGMEVAV